MHFSNRVVLFKSVVQTQITIIISGAIMKKVYIFLVYTLILFLFGTSIIEAGVFLDRDIDGSDLAVFALSMNSKSGDAQFDSSLDFDNNNIINNNDLVIFSQFYGNDQLTTSFSGDYYASIPFTDGAFPLRFSINEAGEISADYYTGEYEQAGDHIVIAGELIENDQYRSFMLQIRINGAHEAWWVDGRLFPNGDFEAMAVKTDPPHEEVLFSGEKVE